MALRLDLADLDAIAAEHAPHLAPAKGFEPGSPEYANALNETLRPPSAGETSASPLPDKLATPAQPAAEKPLEKSGLYGPQSGREAFKAGMPAVTDQPGTPGFYREKIQQAEYKKEHPWGSPVSEHPGFLGKVGHVLGEVGNVAGDVLAPSAMGLIPGTQLNRQLEENHNEGKLAQAKQAEATEGYRDAIVENNANKTKQTDQKALDALAEHGLTRDEQGNITPLPPEKLSAPAQQKLKDSQQLDAYRKAQTDLAEANEELKRAQNDPNSPQFKMAMRKLQMAQLAHEIAAQNLGLHESQFQNKLQEQELLKPSGQAQSRGSAAQAVLDLIPDLEKNVRANAAQMGPLMGRLNRGEIAIGNVPPDVARLYSAMKSFYALQPAVHGFRNAEFVKDFEHALGTLERDPEAFIAGMQGLKPTLESVAKEGKTSHKRIVEGRDTPAPGGGGQQGNEGDTRTNRRTGEVQKFTKGQWQTVTPAKQ